MVSSEKKRYTLTIDDDPLVSKTIERITGIRSYACYSVNQALRTFSKLRPEAIFVDVDLGDPEISGIKLVPKLRKKFPYLPIFILTSSRGDDILSQALSSGADDFLPKPIRAVELKARLQLRKSDANLKREQRNFSWGDLRFELTSGKLRSHGKEVLLSPMTARLFLSLVQAKGTVLSRGQLKEAGWKGVAVTDNSLDQKMKEIRRALTEMKSCFEVKSVYGKGYQLAKKEKEVRAIEELISPKRVEGNEL